MIAAANGPAASTMSRTNRSTPGQVGREAVRQPGRVRVEAEAQDAADRRRSAPPAARGRSPSLRRGGRAAARSGALDTGVGVGSPGAGRPGRTSPGRDSPSRPDTSVRAMTSSTVQSGAAPSSRTSLRSTIWPRMWRNAIASPTGDQTGAHDAPSLVRRSSSRPLAASRMTTSLPKLLCLVAAMYSAVGRARRLEVARAGQRRRPSSWRRPSGR